MIDPADEQVAPLTLDIVLGDGRVDVADPRMSAEAIAEYQATRDVFLGLFPGLSDAQREAAFRVWEMWPPENRDDPRAPRASIGVWHGIVLAMADDRPPIVIAPDGAMAELAETWPPPPRPIDPAEKSD